MLVLNSADVRRAYPMETAVQAMKSAFASFSAGKAEVPHRTHLPVEPFNGTTLVMSSFVDDKTESSLAVKVVSLFPGNVEKGKSLIQAAVLVLDCETGQVKALLEGSSLTAIRTGAASGAATDLIASKECRTAAVFGAGVQARTQLDAICTVRDLETVRVYSPYPDEVRKFIHEMSGKGRVPEDIRAAASSSEAVSEADIICTATTASDPVFLHRDLKPGVHINAIGSYREDVCEIPAETVSGSLVFVESREAALSEAGELIQSMKKGLISDDHIAAELGELVLKKKTVQKKPGQTTLFKSVGVAVQDAVSAREILIQAEKQGLGTNVELQGV